MSAVGQFLKNLHRRELDITRSLIVASAGTVFVNFVFVLFPKFWANLFIGKTTIASLPTFQDIMWVIFFYGLTLVVERRKLLKLQQRQWEKRYLPEDFETIIDDHELTQIIKKVKGASSNTDEALPYMILQIALQYRTNQSIALVNEFLTKQIDLFLHSIELGFNRLKYIIWVIPSIGFMGTVYGIGLAVSKLGDGSLDDPDLLTKMAGDLGIAFNTTLLALILSVILQFMVQQYESKEEEQINLYGKYILDNLINKIVEKK